LAGAMRSRVFDEILIEKVCFKNWLRVLRQTWKETE
jgi:microsomal dipeptidase-like Zn-dependent dipeptidase